MFCSKCGKEINDSAAFCDKCGAKIGGSDNNSRSASSYSYSDEMSQDEKVAKTRFLSEYISYEIFILVFLSLILFGDMSLFISSMDSTSTVGHSFSDALEGDIFETFILLAFIAGLVINVINYFKLMFNKRECDSKKESFKISSLLNCILIPIFMIALAIIGKIEFAVGAYVVLALYIVFNITMIILFNKAAEEESAARYKANHSTSSLLKKLGVEDKPEGPERPDASVDWTCKDCGRLNKAIDSYCKDCGKYR